MQKEEHERSYELLYFNVLSMCLMGLYYTKCVSLFDTRSEWNCHRDQRLIKSKVCSPKKVTTSARWGESDPERSRLWLAFLDLFLSVIHDIQLDVECLWYDIRSCLFHADHVWMKINKSWGNSISNLRYSILYTMKTDLFYYFLFYKIVIYIHVNYII
jgi:hypothetical protein